MAVGTSGVAGTSSAFGAADRVLDLVRNAELYQKRMADLEAATKAAEDAKREARRIIANARTKAEADAKEIVDGAEKKATERLNAVQESERQLSENKAAWEKEKAEEQAKLRSERGKASASKTRCDKAKEDADEEKRKARVALEDHRAAKLAIQKAVADTQAIWKGVGV